MENVEDIKKIASRCLNCKTKPCQKGCPLGNDIPSFIAFIKEGKWKEAYEVLSDTTIMSAVCGEICPHQTQCQGKCVRGIKEEPVQIGRLESYVGEMALREEVYNKADRKKCGKSIAIVGGGPAGLTAAAFLKRKSYNVTIYEQEELLRRYFKLWNTRISFTARKNAKTCSKYIESWYTSQNKMQIWKRHYVRPAKRAI